MLPADQMPGRAGEGGEGQARRQEGAEDRGEEEK
jgi:hypothetical protein